MKQDMKTEFKKQFPIPKYINRLMVRHNYAQASAGWDAAWQHRQQELDAARLEVERLNGDIAAIRNSVSCYDSGDCEAFECVDDIRKYITEFQALAAQQEKG